MSAKTQGDGAEAKGGNGVGGRLAAVGIVLAGLAGVVALAALLPKRGEDKPPAAAPPVNITVLPIVPRPEMDDTFDLYGVIEPNRVVDVAAEVPGRVERFGVRGGKAIDEGVRVEIGQELVLLNQDLLQAEHDQAKARKEFDEGEYSRILRAEKEGAATQMQLDKARTARDASRAQFQAARARLDRATLISPAGGVLDDLPVEIGEYVRVGDTVARIVDVDKVKIVLDVPEFDVHHLRVGQGQTIFLNGGGKRTGKITFISELADEQTRTSRVEITVGNPRRDLRAGQIVRVRLSRRRLKDVVMIPLRAVIPEENGKAVYVERNGQAERRPVELGFFRDEDVRVVKGLEAGDRLIVAGYRYVADGQAVRVVSTETDGAIRTARGAEQIEDAP